MTYVFQSRERRRPVRLWFARCRSLIVAALALFAAAAPSAAHAGGPSIDVVVGAQAAPVEKCAAEELSAILKKLFDAEVRIGDKLPTSADNVMLLGTQASLPETGRLQNAWPASERAHTILSWKLDDRPVLVLCGGSPRAVLWAVYDYAYRQGMRSFLFDDLYPTSPPKFTTAGFDVKTEAATDLRSWRPTFVSAIDEAAWGRDDLLKLVRQATKLRVSLLDLSALNTGATTTTPVLPISVSGDVMGRAAFKGAKEFGNPDYAAANSPAEVTAAAKKTWDEVRTECERLGWEVVGAPTAGVKLSQISVLPNAHAEFLFLVPSEAKAPNTTIPEAVYAEMLTPVCGEEVHTRVMKAFEFDAQAAAAVIKYDAVLGAPGPLMLMRHFESNEPPPAWWADVRKNYLDAMNEMYRANTRAREGGRAFTLYYARRFEFGFEYLNAVEAIRNAGIAKRKGDAEAQIAELEKAIDAVTNACNAMAAVARNQSDRGVIAVMNEYGYRPLLKMLDEADAAAN